jgi:hypothetical protein
MPVVAKGTPLSVRIARGSPYSRNRRSKTGRTPMALRGEQAVTGQEVAGVLVGDRQGIAVDAVARAEVALEVSGPEIVGLRGRRRDDAGMLVVAPAAPLLD